MADKQYSYKEHKLSEHERLWLEEVAAAKDKFNVKAAKIKLKDQLPKDFDPNKIDHRLYSKRKLGIIGLKLVEPNNPLFHAMDKTIRTIRDMILKEKSGREKFTSKEISKVAGIDEELIGRALKKLSDLGQFWGSGGGTREMITEIHLSGDNGYDEYLHYEGLDEILERYYKQHAPLKFGMGSFGGGSSGGTKAEVPKGQKNTPSGREVTAKHNDRIIFKKNDKEQDTEQDFKGTPTEEEIRQLPRWAQVAFAARCAWRVHPLFKASWPDAPQDQVDAVVRVIEMAENAAASPKSSKRFTTTAFNAAENARLIASMNTRLAAREAAHEAVRVGAYAADAAAIAAMRSEDDQYSTYKAIRAAATAAERAGSKETESLVIAGIRRDFEHLFNLSIDNKWDDETPVSPDVFGKMWPYGEPDWKQIAQEYKNLSKKEDVPSKALTLADAKNYPFNFYTSDFDGGIPVIIDIAKRLSIIKEKSFLESEILLLAIAVHGIESHLNNTASFFYRVLLNCDIDIEEMYAQQSLLTKEQVENFNSVSSRVLNIFDMAKDIADRTVKIDSKGVSTHHLLGSILVFPDKLISAHLLLEKLGIDVRELCGNFFSFLKTETRIPDDFQEWERILINQEIPEDMSEDSVSKSDEGGRDGDIEDAKEGIGTIATLASDKPGIKDLLGRELLAQSLSKMFVHTKDIEGLTVALLGDWGEGKSTVMKLVENELEGGAFEFAMFNAWEYEHTDNIAAGLAQEVLKGLLSFKNNAFVSFFKRLYMRVAFACKVHLWGVIGLCSCILIAATGSLLLFWKRDLFWLGITSASFFPLLLKVYGAYKRAQSHSLAVQMLKYLKLPEYHKHLGLIPALKKDIQILCDLRLKRKNKKLLVFVDDLDRCQPGCISKTLDAIRLVMSIPNVIVMIGIDHRIAFKAVEKTYEELGDDDGRNQADIARDYLGKIILLPVRLMATGPEELKEYVDKKLCPDAIESLPEPKASSGEGIAPEPATDSRSRDERFDVLPEVAETEDLNSVKTPPSSQPTKEELQEQEIEEAMRETTEERDRFYDLAVKFKFSNPRQLLRLRNCYRLLKALNSQKEHQIEDLLPMIFWQEFLHAQRREMRNWCMAVLKDKTHVKMIEDRDVRQIVNDICDEIATLFQPDGEYKELAEFVRCVVLPHSEEGVFDTSEEVEEWIERQDSNMRISEKKHACPLGLKIV
jgi:hypothetical protein